MNGRIRRGTAALFLLLLAGCGTFRRCELTGSTRWWAVNTARPLQVSLRTGDTLRAADLGKLAAKEPERARRELAAAFKQEPHRDWAYALAEMSLADAERRERKNVARVLGVADERADAQRRVEVAQRYFDALRYAYAYLFAEEIIEPLNPLDPRSRLAADLYNQSLAQLVAIAQKQRRFDPRGRLDLPLESGVLSFQVVQRGFPYRADEIDELVPAPAAKAREVATDYRQYGIGLPLLALSHRERRQDSPDRFTVPCHPFAVTAVLRPDLADLFAARGSMSKSRRLACRSAARTTRSGGALAAGSHQCRCGDAARQQ